MLSLSIAAVVATGAQPPDCAYDKAEMLVLPRSRFDESLGQGWRAVADRPGCERIAADLIASYRAANAASLVEGSPEDIRSLDWHEGQLRAAVGETTQAIALMQRGSHEPDEAGDSLYHLATIDYLRHDRAALLDIRKRLAALPKPVWYDEVARRAVMEYHIDLPKWPPHVSEVDGLINCFDKPYAQAYTVECRAGVK